MPDPMNDRMTTGRRWFGRGRTRSLLAAGLLLGTGAVATSAYWSTARSVPGTVITAGAMHIDLGTNVQVKPETYSFTALNLNGITSGNSRAATIAVTNNSSGALSFGYRVQGSATNTVGTTMAAALGMTVRRGGTVSGTTCTGGTLVGTANASLNGYDAPVGSTLARGASETLCIQVTLNSAVPTGATATVNLTFPATQVP